LGINVGGRVIMVNASVKEVDTIKRNGTTVAIEIKIKIV
jgi:hypothetical protein